MSFHNAFVGATTTRFPFFKTVTLEEVDAFFAKLVRHRWDETKEVTVMIELDNSGILNFGGCPLKHHTPWGIPLDEFLDLKWVKHFRTNKIGEDLPTVIWTPDVKGSEAQQLQCAEVWKRAVVGCRTLDRFRTKGSMWREVQNSETVCTLTAKKRCDSLEDATKAKRSFQVKNVNIDIKNRVDYPSFDFWDEDVCRQYMALFLNAKNEFQSPAQYEPCDAAFCTIKVPKSCALKYATDVTDVPTQDADVTCAPSRTKEFKRAQVTMQQSVYVFGLRLPGYEHFSYFKIIKEPTGFTLCWSAALTSDFDPV